VADNLDLKLSADVKDFESGLKSAYELLEKLEAKAYSIATTITNKIISTKPPDKFVVRPFSWGIN